MHWVSHRVWWNGKNDYKLRTHRAEYIHASAVCCTHQPATHHYLLFGFVTISGNSSFRISHNTRTTKRNGTERQRPINMSRDTLYTTGQKCAFLFRHICTDEIDRNWMQRKDWIELKLMRIAKWKTVFFFGSVVTMVAAPSVTGWVFAARELPQLSISNKHSVPFNVQHIARCRSSDHYDAIRRCLTDGASSSCTSMSSTHTHTHKRTDRSNNNLQQKIK